MRVRCGGIRALVITCLGASAAFGQNLPPHVAVLSHDGSSYARKLNGSANVAPREAIARRFYDHHRDEYDFLVVFPAFEAEFDKEAIGLNNLVRNEVAGIGLPIVDGGLQYGSPSRLRAYIDVGALMPLAPDPTVDGALGVIAHEVEHAWGPAVRFRDPSTGIFSDDLLGMERSHWSFFLDSNASVMFGSRWQAAGNGVFAAVESRRRYSDLDLYLMGFLPPEQVADFALLVPSSLGRSPTDLPPPDGTTIAATARTIQIGDVIAAEGPRVPSAASSPRLFRAAFILLLAPGQSATPAQLAFVDAVRAAWENEFFFLTRGLALMQTTLVEQAPQLNAPGSAGFVALQRADGSWADSPGTGIRDTQTALEALALLRNQPGTPAAVAGGSGFLASATPANVDEAARRVLGQAAAQADTSRALQDLDALITLSRGGSDGYGLGRGYQGTAVDSILAGLAQLAAGTGPAALSSLNALIAGFQNGDGGWPYVRGGPSRIEPTALALRYLRRLPLTPAVAAQVGKGLAFLGSRRNEHPENALPGGVHYSDDLASAPATALAAIALLEWEGLSVDEVFGLEQALSDLSSRASASYPSAIATKALRLLQVPNPAISAANVALSSDHVFDGETVMATATVRNPSGGEVPPTALRVYDSAGRVLGGTTVALGPMRTVTVSFPLDTTGHAGSMQAFFVVNADGALEESRTDDDRVAVPLVIEDRPAAVDLFAVAGSLVAAPAAVTAFPTTLTVSGQVGNLGRQAAAGVTVSLVVQGRTAASTLVDLAAGSVIPVSFQVQVASGTVEVPISLVVDPQNAIVEAREDNNSIAFAVPIVPRKSVVIDSFTLSSTTVTQGAGVGLSFAVRNAGTLDAGRPPVSVTVRDPSGIVVATPFSESVDLPPGTAVSRQAVWKALAAGTFTLRLGIADQTATALVQVAASGLPNLAVAPGGIAVAPAAAVGKTSQVEVPVLNTGSAAGPFAVDVYAGDPAQGHRLGRQIVTALSAGATSTVRVPFTPDSPQPVALVAVVDADNAVQEFDETDNSAVLVVTPLSLPDLAIANGDVRPDSVLVRAGSQVSVAVTVHNGGAQDAAQVPVDLWLGDPAQGGRRLGSQLLPSVPGRGSADASFTWNTTGLSGLQTLVAIANATGAVTESDPSNDRASRTVLVQDGTIAVTNAFISPNGDGIQDFTDVFFRVPDGSAATVTVMDAKGTRVRTLQADASTSASVRWDGRNDQGAIVDDGAYLLDVAAGANALGRVRVVVDDNREPVEDAPAKNLLAVTQLPALPVGTRNTFSGPVPDVVSIPAMMPDDSGFVLLVQSFPTCAFFLQPAEGGEPRRLSPDWNCGLAAPTSAAVSPDGRRILFTTGGCDGNTAPAECNSIRSYSIADQSFTTVLHITDTLNLCGLLPLLFTNPAFTGRGNNTRFQEGIVLSPAGDKILYRLTAAGCRFFLSKTRIEVANVDGSGRISLSTSFDETYRFSPDGSAITTGTMDFGTGASAYSPTGQLLAFVGSTSGPSGYDWLPDSSAVVTQDFMRLIVTPYPFASLFSRGGQPGFDGGWPPDWWFNRPVSFAVSPATGAILSSLGPDIRLSKPLGTPSVPLWTLQGGDVANLKWAPHASYLLILARDPLKLKPDSVGGYAFHTLTSLANLTARISASHEQGSGELTFTGTATDLNFAEYEIDVQGHGGGSPATVVVRSDVPVIDGLLGRWVPRAPGIFDVTLIARDRAGNVKSSQTTVAWSKQAAVTDLSVSPTYISPNGDGVQDTTTLTYTVLSPLTTQFQVVGPDQSVVRRFDQTHVAAGTYTIVWDGRDAAGNVVPDGKYLFRAESGGVVLVVDRTPPLVFQAFANGDPPQTLPGDQASLDLLADLIDASHGFQTFPHEVVISGFFRSSDANGVSWKLEQSATPDFADARIIGTGNDARWWGYPNPPLPISELRGTWTRVTARDAAGNVGRSRPRAMFEELFFLSAGDASLLGPDLRVTSLPWTNETGVPFAPGRYAFQTAFSGATRIVSYAMRYPSASGGTLVDFANVQQLAEDVFIWDARAVGWPIDSLEIDAIDDLGRTFTAKVPLQPRQGKLDGLTACMSAAPPAVILGAKLAAPVLKDAHVELRRGFGPPERVADFPNPHWADGYLFTVPTDFLGSCHYDVFFSAHDLTGKLLTTETAVDVCGMALTDGPSFAANAKASARIASSFPLNVAAVDVFLTDAGETKRVASAGGFFQLSPKTLLDLTGVPGCAEASVTFAARFSDGTSWRTPESPDATPMCSGTKIPLPCISLAVGASQRDADAAFCASRDPLVTFPLTARTDKPGGSIVRIEALLKSLQTLAMQPLPVAPFNPGAAVNSSVTVPTAPLSEGLYALGVKIVDEAGVTLQTGVDFATGLDVLDGLDFSNIVTVDRVPPRAGLTAPLAGTRVCAARSQAADGTTSTALPVAGFASDPHLEAYAVLLRRPGDSLYQALDLGAVFGANFSTAVQASFTGRPSGDYELAFAGRDVSGSWGCSTPVPVHVDAAINVSALGIGTPIFSPDGDGVQDSTSVTFSLDEPGQVTVSVARSPGSWQVVDSNARPAGGGQFTWNGFAAGAVVPDGQYALRVAATDSCGNGSVQESSVTVDTVAPVARIDSPVAGAAGSVLAVLGEASDANFRDYDLSLVSGSTETLLAHSTSSAVGTLVSIDLRGFSAGSYVLRLVARDFAGHSSVANVSLTVVPPMLVDAFRVAPSAISPGRPGATAVATVTLRQAANATVTVLDAAGTSVAVAFGPAPLQAGATSISLDAALASLPDATYRIRLTASAAGTSEIADAALTVDRVAPALRIDAPAPAAFVSGAVDVTGSISDPLLSSWSISLKPAAGSETVIASGTSPRSGLLAVLRGLSDGSYQLVVRASDAAGNAAEANVPFSEDSTAPVVSFVTPRDGSSVSGRSGPVRISVSVSEPNLARLQLDAVTPSGQRRLYDGPLPNGGQLTTWDVAAEVDGPASLTLTAQDRAGNSATAVASLNIDNTLPIAHIDSPRDGFLRAGVPFVGTASDTNLARWSLAIAKGTSTSPTAFSVIASGTSAVTSGVLAALGSLPADGAYTARLSVLDRAGNESVDAASFTVDTTPPAPPPSLSATVVQRSNVQLVWTASPDSDVTGYFVERATGIGAFQVITASAVVGTIFTDTGVPDRDFHYRVRALDAAGFASDPSPTATVSIHARPPQVSIFRPVSGTSVGGVLDVVGAVSSFAPLDHWTLALGDTAPLVLARGTAPVASGRLATVDTAQLPQGPQTFVLEAADVYGNVGRQSVSVIIDDQPPAAPVLLSATAAASDVLVSWTASPEPDVIGYLLYRNGQIANAPEGSSIADVTRYLLPASQTTTVDHGLPDGTFTYQVQAVDAALNASPLSNSIDVTIEQHTPSAVIVSPVALAMIPGPVPVLADVVDQDVSSVQFEVRSGAASFVPLGAPRTRSPWTVDLDPSAFASRVLELHAIATDRSGHVDPKPASVFVFFDPPLSQPSLSALTDGQAVNVSWTDPDPADRLGAFQLSRDATPFGTATDKPAGTASASSGNAAAGYDANTSSAWQPSGAPPHRWQLDLAQPALAQSLSTNFLVSGQPRADISVKLKGVWVPVGTLFPTSASPSATLTFPRPLVIEGARYDFTLPAGAAVGIFDERVSVLPTVAGTPFAEVAVPLGSHQYVLTVFSPFGQTAVANAQAHVYAPILDPLPAAVPQAGLQVSGRADPGATVHLLRAGVEIGTSLADANGVFTAAIMLVPGSNALAAQATDAAGNRSLISSAAAVILDPPPAAVPALLATVSGSDVSLSWSISGDPANVAGFQISRAGGADAPVPIAVVGAQTVSYVDRSLPNGDYTYLVAAVNAHLFAGPLSNPAAVRVAVAPPGAPTALVVTAAPAGGELDLTWSPATGSVASYVVERAVATGPFQPVATGVTTTAWSDFGLTDGVLYSYRVIAVDAVGNRGPSSNVASGIPHDSSVPAAPEIRKPTTPGSPISLGIAQLSVGGAGPAGTTVHLFQNGTEVGSSPAEQQLARDAVGTARTPQTFAASRDGSAIAYQYASPTGGWVAVERLGGAVQRFEDPAVTMSAPSLSSDGRKVAFIGRSTTTFQSSLYVGDVSSGALTAVAAVPGGDRGVRPSWAPDGNRIAYLRTGSALAVHDLGAQTDTLLASDDFGDIAWARSDSIVAVVSSSSRPQVRRYDVSTQSFQIIFFTVGFDFSMPAIGAVSADGSTVALLVQNKRGLVVLDVASAARQTPADSAFFHGAPAFSLDGRTLSYLADGDLLQADSASGQVVDLGPASLQGFIGDARMAATASGLLLFDPGAGIFSVTAGILWRVDGLALVSGENVFFAIAQKPGGPPSPASQPISVTYDTSLLPDLTVSAEVQPHVPLVGESATAVVTVRNVGRGATDVAPDVAVTVFGADGSVRDARTASLGAPLAAGGSGAVLVPLDLVGLVGAQKVLVRVDPGLRIAQSNRDNDEQTVTLLIAATPASPALAVEVVPDSIPAHSSALATVTVGNPGSTMDLAVRVRLVDSNGSEVLVAGPDEAFTSGSGDVHPFTRSIPSGTTLAGSYRVVAEARSQDVLVASAGAPLQILPDRAITVSLAPRAAAFSTGDAVGFDAQVVNTSLNSLLSGASVELAVTDGHGATVFSRTAPLPLLAQGSAVSTPLDIPAPGLPPGSYTAAARVRADGAVVASAFVPFSVLGQARLEAELEVVGGRGSPVTIPSGPDLRLRIAVVNSGDVAATGVELQVTLLDPATGTAARYQALPIGTLAPLGMDFLGVDFPTAGLPLQTYSLSISAVRDGAPDPERLATRLVRIADSATPLLSTRDLASGMFVRGLLQATVRAQDDFSGTAQVRVSVDGSAPLALAMISGTPLDGVWTAPVRLQPDGPHTLTFSAADLEGNDGAVAQSPGNPLSIAVVSDSVPPVVELGGVADGSLVATPVAPTWAASDLNLASAAATLNGQPFASGTQVEADGDYLLSVTAVDRAGNVTVRSRAFSIDRTAPVISISGVSDGQYTKADAVFPAFSAVDAHLASVSALLDNNPFTSGSAVSSEGTHRLQVSASDTLGSHALALATFTIDRTRPVIQVTGVTNGATYDDAVVPIISVSDSSPVSTISRLNGNPFISGTRVEDDGTYLLEVSATDAAGNASTAAVSFTLFQVRYAVTQGTAQTKPAVLALLKAGKCALPPAEQARISAFISAALGAPDALLTITSEEMAFLSNLRSGAYRLFVWMSLDAGDATCSENQDATCNSAQCATRIFLSRELTELVYSGRAGLVVIRNRTESLPALREVLGADAAGAITASSATFLAGTPFAGMSSLGLGSRAVQLQLLLGSAAGGYDGVSQPAGAKPVFSAAVHSFAQGIGITFAYDLSAATPAGSAAAVLQRAAFAAAPEISPLGPLSVAPVEISVTNLAKPASTRVRQTVPPPVTIFATAPPASIASGLLEWNRDLGTSESAVLRSFLRVPDLARTSTISTEVAALRSGGAKVFGTYALDLVVRESGPDLQADADAAAALLPDSGFDGAVRARIRNALSSVHARAIAGRADIEANLLDLLDAVDAAKTLKSVDPTSVRLALDELVRYWEARWSIF